MSQATKQQTRSARAIVEPDLHTKLIDCVAHPGAHQAVLYCFPHKWAGIWECILTGDSESHEHTNIELESIEPLPITPTDMPAEQNMYICSDCGVEVSSEE